MLEAAREISGQSDDLPQEIRQSQPLCFGKSTIPLDAIVAQVNAGQNDLSMTMVDQPMDLFHDVIRRATRRVGANMRNNAKAASQQTTVLNLDVGPVAIAKIR